jgi:hypothetical protein
VRAAGCVVCPKGVNRPIEAAHVRMACIAIGKRETGMAEKPGDQWTLGLCIYHHRVGIASQHSRGEREFWEYAGLNPFAICQRLWIESGGAARALEPKTAKRPRKTKPRDRNAPKRQIPGRALQSRSTFPQGRKIQSRNGFEKRTTV